LLKSEYNILKTAGSLSDFKQNEAIVVNNNADTILSFTSVRKAANYIGVHHNIIAKSISCGNPG
jgi:hypothetical protein